MQNHHKRSSSDPGSATPGRPELSPSLGSPASVEVLHEEPLPSPVPAAWPQAAWPEVQAADDSEHPSPAVSPMPVPDPLWRPPTPSTTPPTDIEENVSVQGDDPVADDDELTEVVVLANGTPAKANWTVDHDDSGERTVTLTGATPRDLHVTFRNPMAPTCAPSESDSSNSEEPPPPQAARRYHRPPQPAQEDTPVPSERCVPAFRLSLFSFMERYYCSLTKSRARVSQPF